MRKCEIPARTLPPCDLDWGHDGDMHANGGDGFHASEHDEEHHRRQLERRAELELVIFTGMPASGKSTFYGLHLAGTHVHVSKDALPRSQDKEQRQRALIEEHLRAGRSVVADNTSPSNVERGPLIMIARALGAKVTSYFFATTTQASLQRNALRIGKARVPDVAIFTIAKKLVPPAAAEGFDRRFKVTIEELQGFVVKQIVAGVDD